MDRIYLFIFLLIFIFIHAEGKLENLKICVVKTPRTSKYCEILRKSKQTPVSCVLREDRLSCLLAISNKDADFGVFNGEDLYFYTLYQKQSSILVVSEIVQDKKKPFSQEAVVVVRKNSNFTGIKDLRGKTLCHPGPESVPDWNFLFVQYFEERIAPGNCEEGLSINEDRIKSTSEFFGAACKAGSWISDPVIDSMFKRKYSNLCELCESGNCNSEEKYKGFGGSISCFRDNVGEILWGSLEDITNHMKFLDSGSPDDYYFLCDDGTFMTLTSEEPCIWLAKPWPVVAANTKSAKDVQKVVDKLTAYDHNEWEENLLHVMELYLDYIQNLPVLRIPEDYLKKIPGYLSASIMSEGNCKPRHDIKLCVVSSLEQQKCDQMSKAAISLGIQPPITCVKKTNITECLKSVNKKEIDVVIVNPDYFYEATEIYKLRTFLYEIGTIFNDSYIPTLVVRKNSNIKTLFDAKSKNICLTKRHGMGWKIVSSALYEDSCRKNQEFTEYFSNVCVIEGNETDNICCPNIKLTDGGQSKPFFNELTALNCLFHKECDITVVDRNTWYKISDGNRFEFLQNVNLEELEPICFNDTMCHLSWSYPNYLMTSENRNSAKGIEMHNVFYQLGQFFGKNSHKNNQMMKIFGSFHKVQNVLFRDTSKSFVTSPHWMHQNSYSSLIQETRICEFKFGRKSGADLPAEKPYACLFLIFLYLIHFFF